MTKGLRVHFDELQFFSRMKARPELYLGRRCITGLRDMICGIGYAFDFADIFPYFQGFISWYSENEIRDSNGYAAWWNHLLYVNGNREDFAFDAFMRQFERYLEERHRLTLPKPIFKNESTPERNKT